MTKIKSIHAREILDSRGNPTVEVDIITNNGKFSAAVPSGSSVGLHEAVEIRDKNKKRYNGMGVLNAVKNINEKISKKIINLNVTKQREIDQLMIQLDGTENKSRLGANAILAVSMATCRAAAYSKKIPLYKYIAEIAETKNPKIPIPSFNIINGGKHAGNKLAFQEFMIIPTSAPSFKEALRYCAEIYHNLKRIIKEKYGQNSTNVGDEGGFAPSLENYEEALELIEKSIKISGYKDKIKIGIDVAASEFFKNKKYDVSFKNKNTIKKEKTAEEMIEMYEDLTKRFRIVSIEDPFDQDDWDSYEKLTSIIGKKIQIVGDDLLVTNPKRIKKAIEKKACNALLLKMNQIGTITESIEACKIARRAGWNVIVSHRSGETEDNFIADLAVGLGCEQIKAGAPCRSERLSKYNQLIRIEESLKNFKTEIFFQGLYNPQHKKK